MNQTLKRRNISGIYIFDRFPDDNRRKPTCIEDCSPKRRKEWMKTKNREYLHNVILELAKSFKDLTEYCHQEKAVEDECRKELIAMADKWVERSKLNWAEHELADQIDIICEKIILLADAVGVIRDSPKDNNDTDDHETNSITINL